MVTCPKCKETIRGLYFTLNKKRDVVYYKCYCGHKWKQKIK